ncbi:hypothetical protein SAMN05216266_103328 [Amycolatopsis marina]|uniref:Tachylectin n=1 Tax=Amycolatopsis marina TaxID=490629 RepID=A0A1I0XLW2_9PSEU|nr:hypothetical protein SAMN05216266_103328 [Amycolatopsis marina]
MGSDNHLRWRSYDPVAKTWAHRVAARDWGKKYNLIVAAGDDVIYARTPDGKMFRNHYNAANNTWSQYEEQRLGLAGVQVAGIGRRGHTVRPREQHSGRFAVVSLHTQV